MRKKNCFFFKNVTKIIFFLLQIRSRGSPDLAADPFLHEVEHQGGGDHGLGDRLGGEPEEAEQLRVGGHRGLGLPASEAELRPRDLGAQAEDEPDLGERRQGEAGVAAILTSSGLAPTPQGSRSQQQRLASHITQCSERKLLCIINH